MENSLNDKAEEVLENLGIFKKTKLEKLARSFSGVKYEINPDKHNPDTGSINFIYFPSSPYIKRTSKDIEGIAERIYDKNNYLVISTESENGFEIIIWDNFITKGFSAF